MTADRAPEDRSSIRVSVCMATYNGAKYLEAQLTSILDELGPDDEVVIVDDASTDSTLEVARSFADPRLVIIARTRNLGYVRTFEEALGHARGQYLLLSDQDDVWVEGRVDAMLVALERTEVVASTLSILGHEEQRSPGVVDPRTEAQWRRNVIRIVSGVSGYYGCGMGMRASFRNVVLPFPSYLRESHDLWLALAGNLAHSMTHLATVTLLRRVHGDNVTPLRPRNITAVLRARVMLVRSIVELRRRIRRASIRV